jgi:hypothetical protein
VTHDTFASAILIKYWRRNPASIFSVGSFGTNSAWFAAIIFIVYAAAVRQPMV